MKDAEVVKTEASFFVPKRKEVMPMIVLKALLLNFFIIIAWKMSNFIMKGQKEGERCEPETAPGFG